MPIFETEIDAQACNVSYLSSVAIVVTEKITTYLITLLKQTIFFNVFLLLNPVTTVGWHNLLTGRHFPLASTFCWKPHLAGSHIWLEATFGWHPLVLAALFG